MASKRTRGPQSNPDRPSPEARRKQVIVGIVVGAIVGIVISFFTQFWLWLPAGIALGLASGAIIKPPAE